MLRHIYLMYCMFCMSFYTGPLQISGSFFYPSLSVPPLSTGSGSILEAGARCASPGISIERTGIVVVRTSYIWSYISVLLYRGDFGLGNRTRHMLPIVCSPHEGVSPFLLDFLGGFRTTRSLKNV